MTITAFPFDRVDYRPKLLSECRIYSFDQPYVSTPYNSAPLLPWPWLIGLFFLGWMARG
jgi:hypothetical protein